MATLKAIQNNYELLDKRERFGLYQKASLRRDDNELAAIHSATPMKGYNVIDFYFLREEIYRIDTVNLLVRLGHKEMFEMFLRFSEQEEDHKKGDYLIQAAKMSAYLYVIETDAWTIVCEELGLEVNWFRSLSSQISFAVEMMDKQDSLLRGCALSEDEARAFIKQSGKRLKVADFVKIKTLDEQIEFYRNFIDEI
jgi:hypothetical protein